MNPRPDEHLSAWLDGELDEAEAAELEAELARDPELRAELQTLESVVRLLREEGPTQAPLGFERRVMARVEQEFPEGSSWWGWMRRPWGIPLEGWVLGLAAAAALLLVLPIWRHGARSDVPSELPEQELSPAAVEPPKVPPPVSSPEVPAAEVAASNGKVIGRATTGEDSLPKRQARGDAEGTTVVGGTQDTTESEPPSVGRGGTQLAPSGTAAEEPASQGDPSSPYQYVVRSEDAGMKREILAIASRYGTGAKDLAQRPIVDSKMRAGTEELVVSLAQTDLASFSRDLAARGYVVETVAHPDDDSLLGGTVDVRVTLQLVGGALDEKPGIPNASRMSKEPAAAESLDEAP